MASLREVMRRRGVPGSLQLEGLPPARPDPMTQVLEQRRAMQAMDLEEANIQELMSRAQASIARAEAEKVKAEASARRAQEPPPPAPAPAAEGSNGLVKDLLGKLLEVQGEHMKGLQEQFKEARQLLMRDTQSNSTAAPPKSVVEELQSYKQLFELVQTMVPSKQTTEAATDLRQTMELERLREESAERAALREHQMDLDRTRLLMEREDLQQRQKLAWEDWESKKEQRRALAEMVKDNAPIIAGFAQQLLQARNSPAPENQPPVPSLYQGGGGFPVAPESLPAAGHMRLSCPACTRLIDIDPGPGATRWRCPACQAVLLHPSPGATRFDLLQALSPSPNGNGHLGSELLAPPGPPAGGYIVTDGSSPALPAG